MKGLNGKNAIVTGGGGGIGRAICSRLVEEGCNVGVFDIDANAAERTVDAIGGEPSRAFTVDITELSSVESGVAEFEATIGPTDILINNAGWDKLGYFLDTDPSLWQKIISINLWGPMHMHYAVAQRMVERKHGRIVNISSDSARVGSSGEAVYSACKGAVIAFSKTLARELARAQICVNVVSPGPTDTPLLQSFLGEGETGRKIYEGLQRAIPFKRLGQPADVVGAVVFLASEDAGFITGQVLSVSGGLTMAG